MLVRVSGSRSVFPVGCKVELDKSWRHRNVVAEVGTLLLSCVHIHTYCLYVQEGHDGVIWE